MEKSIYFDMDGVLNKFELGVPFEDTFKRGFFSSREPHWIMIDLVKRLYKSGYKIHILSAVYQDDHSKAEKIDWLKKVDLLDKVDAIFVPYGENKKEYVEKEGCKILFDDFTPNLKDWEQIPDFIGIKVFTPANTVKGYGSWHGLSIDIENNIELLEAQIKGLIDML